MHIYFDHVMPKSMGWLEASVEDQGALDLVLLPHAPGEPARLLAWASNANVLNYKLQKDKGILEESSSSFSSSSTFSTHS